MTGWNDKKEKRALRRYRFTFVFRVIRILAIIFFVYTLYVMVISIGYQYSKKGNKLNAYAQLAIDWQYPGVSSEYINSSTEINPFLTQKTSVPIIRHIGKNEENIGELKVNKPLFMSLMNVQYEFEQKSFQPNFDFWLPYHPETGITSDLEDDINVWDTLEKVHEGTVAELAFSTSDFLTPEEILTLLSNFDLAVKWMPVYMGELQEFTEGSHGSNSVAVNSWGLTEGKEYDDRYRLTASTSLSGASVEENKQVMIDNMKRIYKDDPKLAEKIFNTSYFDERIQFIEENGFMVYGAVITGPSKELLKLKELDEIGGVQLGEVQLWNW